jgi:hypothetical protein
MHRLAILACVAVAAAACAPASPPAAHPPAPPAPRRGEITAEGLRRDLFVFASDSFRGRETGTPDAERAAGFLATRLASLGLEPAGDGGSYLQAVPLARRVVVPMTGGDGRGGPGRAEMRIEHFTAHNVVAVVRGRDPTLRESYVAYGAHYDHIGVQPPEAGDSIANGADDDGSGSVSLLALAEAFATAPERPRRSILFVWHVGEEQGLFGSSYFTDHPTVPLDSIVAQLNADMIGRNAPDSLYIVGPAAAPNGQSRVLGQIVDSVNRALPRPFLINREWDSPTHPEQIYYRSDHYNYARRGVPIVFFTSGLHADYHRVTDEPAKIDYDKLARVDRLLYEVGRAVADRPTRPR